MASDNHANFAVIGFTVCLGVAAIVGTLIYIGGVFGNSNELLVETCYDKPVNGLSVGSTVNFRGVKIGEVREISFVGNKYEDVSNPADESRIYILMAVKPDAVGQDEGDSEAQVKAFIKKMVVQRGLRVTVTLSGITGLSRVECDFHDDLPSYRALSWNPTHPFIPPKESLLDSFSVSATKVMNQINKMDLSAAWSNISTAVESLARVSESARMMVEARQGEIDQLMTSVTEAAQSAKELVNELKHNPSLLVREREYEPLEETKR